MNIQKWRLAYFVLAILDLVAVGSSLAVNHRLGTAYSQTVQADEFWAGRLQMMEELQILASDVNAPGNDIFDSRDVKMERHRLVQALKRYNEHYFRGLSDLKNQSQSFSLRGVLSRYEAIQIKMEDMVAETQKIFTYFERGQKTLADSRMATMDRKYALLRQALIHCNQEIRSVQSAFLREQKSISERLRYFEIIFSIFIALMVVGIFSYGTVISRFINNALEDKTLLEEQTNALNAAAIVAITDLKGRITHVNEKFIEISGYSKEELLGADHRILNSGHHSKDFFRTLWQTIGSGKIWNGEVRNRKKDGSYYWVDSTVIPVRNAHGSIWQYISVRFDITKRKEYEEMIKAQQSRLEDAEITGKFGSWELDLTNMQGQWSRGHNLLFGIDGQHVEPTFETFVSLLVPEDREKPQAVIREILGNNRKEIDIDYRIHRKDGELRHIKGYGKVLCDNEGKPLRIKGTVQDITELKTMEKKLVASREEAIAATKTKSTFLANMSHEIRTPMNGIIGMANLLMASSNDPVQTERLQIIQNCGNSLLELINDVLDFSKLEVDKIELEKLPLHLHSVTGEIVDLLSTRASEKGISLSYRYNPNVPAWIIGDVTRFRQILTNLVSNAIKFTQHGKVEIAASAERQNDKNWLIRFSVKDTGIGIPDHVRDKLFQSFSQMDASTTRRFGGSGLGLAICKGLVEKMGGNISVESVEGTGSTFSFTMKAEECRAMDVDAKGNPFALFDPNMGKTHPLRILVAEDNKTNQMVVMGILGKIGYHADVVSTGAEALHMLGIKQYDLVLMDCHMPEMDGFEATRQIAKKWDKNQRPRIIALTASTMKEDVDQCYASGMDGFISKPIVISVLVEQLKACAGIKKNRIAS